MCLTEAELRGEPINDSLIVLRRRSAPIAAKLQSIAVEGSGTAVGVVGK